jgi:hypothetical protein
MSHRSSAGLTLRVRRRSQCLKKAPGIFAPSAPKAGLNGTTGVDATRARRRCRRRRCRRPVGAALPEKVLGHGLEALDLHWPIIGEDAAVAVVLKASRLHTWDVILLVVGQLAHGFGELLVRRFLLK